jgi:hypothetical protein
MPQYWMITTSPKNFQVSKSKEFTVEGFKERNRKQVQKVMARDKFVYYISGKQKFGAISEATSGFFFDEKTRIWTEEDEIWPCRFRVKPIVVLPDDELLDVKKLVPLLSFITERQKKVKWGLAFHQSLRVIPEEDFELIESEMKKILSKSFGPSEKGLLTEKQAREAIITLPLENKSLHDRLGEMLETIGSWMGYNVDTRHKITPDHHQELDVVWLRGKNPEMAIEIQISGSLIEAIDRLVQSRDFNYRKVIMVIAEDQLSDLNARLKFDPFKNWLDAWSIQAVYSLYTNGRSFFELYEKLQESRYRERKEVELVK